MKKVVLVLFFAIGALSLSQAQEVGIRFGDALGNNVALDAVFSTGEFNRIHADLTFGNGIGAEALWDFIYRPLGGEAFNWYAGVGPSLFIGDYGNDVDVFLLGVAGEIGLEYRFNSVPIVLGLDYRPVFILIEETDFDAGGFGFNVRWNFGG